MGKGGVIICRSCGPSPSLILFEAVIVLSYFMETSRLEA